MADTPIEKTQITLDDLVRMGSDARVEVIDGEAVEMSPVGGLHHIIVGNINRILDGYVIAREIGTVFVDGLIYLMHSESSGLKDSFVPDVSFLRNESIPEDWDINLPFPGAPDLAVEVVSPGDDAARLMYKVRKYLDVGTQQVWVVYPDVNEVHQYRHDADPETIHIYRGSQKLDASPLFPDLDLTVETIFTLPKWAK